MAPTPNQEPDGPQMPAWDMTEDIVISGVSGRFPESDTVDEFAKNLFDNVDMITEDDRRWPIGLYGLPSRAGKIKDLSKFDAQFFGVHGKQANLMDPQARMLLELTYEAICDAGINPQTLRGTRTGVYVGASVSEVEEGLAQDVSKVSGYALTGCSRSMFANRISYTFDFQGPSYAMDTACSSSFLAFQQAILGLRTGQCDQAIVGGTQICLRPVTALQFHKLNMLSSDGKCKYMDANADGYVRSEACSVVFLQKKSESKRIYATIVHAKTNTDGYKKEGITFPSRDAQAALMRETYLEAKINPRDIVYLEAHGTGTKQGDPQEAAAIADVLCDGRKEPLLIGSVKTNMGHTEPASGLCSLAKVLIAFEKKSIPANLHFEEANLEIEPLVKGQLKPVTVNTPLEDGYAALNSFGFGGVNVHVILKPNDKEPNKESTDVIPQGFPRLVNMCGRTEEAVNHVFDFIENHPHRISREFLSLLNDISKTNATGGMNYRGYMLMKKKQVDTESFNKEVMRVPDKRPLWFVFSGMGSQWPAMAQGLMGLPIFARTIHRCAEVLKPYGVDLLHLLLEDDEKALDTTVAPFVSIAAVQIALVDVLRAMGIEPDGIVGHSVGELGCAYGDGCFNLEQMMMSAYWRGKCVEEAALSGGLMAAVGLSWEECKKRCPEGVVPACHNSEDSVTISGPFDLTKKFVEQLKSENIFAREVKSCGVAFHSKYVAPIAPTLMERLAETLPEPKLRSSRWVSSSVPEEKWDTDACKYSAPTYYVTNLVSPVLFHEALKHVPKNGIMIELAPHTLLQAILKRALGSDMHYIGFMKRGNNQNQMDFFFQNIGKLYSLGLNPKIENLYPRVEYPVPKGTQSVSSLIQWDHSQNWLVTQYPEYFNPSSSSDYVVKVDIADAEDEYLAGHCIDSRTLYPATGYLMLAWKMLAKIKGQFHDKIPVEFENVTLHRATILNKTTPTKFVIRMMETSGEFSISEGGSIVATGRVFVPEDPVLKLGHIVEQYKPQDKEHVLELTPKDIYKELRVRGYDYGTSFQGLTNLTEDGRKGSVKWAGNWISFADSMLQCAIIGKKNRNLFLPVRFQAVRCDPRILLKCVEETPDMPVVFDPRINVIVTKGLEIRGLKVNMAPRRQGIQQPQLEKYQFVPNVEEVALTCKDKRDLESYLSVTGTLAARILSKAGKSAEASAALGGRKAISDAEIIALSEAPYEEQVLLSVLSEVKGSIGDAQILASTKYGKELNNDVLNQVYTRERFIRPLVDLVCENMRREISVLEINATSNLLTRDINKYIACNFLEVDYTVAHPNPSDLKEVPEDVTLSEWNKTRIALENNSQDFVIYKDGSTQLFGKVEGVTLQSVIDSFSAVTKSNGFALGLLRDKLTPQEALIHSSDIINPKRVDEFVSKAEKAGFTVVSKKSDGLTSTAVLLRKTIEKPVSSQTIIPIVNGSYKWVDDLKSALLTHTSKANGENVWLVSQDGPSSGILGLVSCIRNEPGGDKVRCIFNMDNKGTSVNFASAPFNNILKQDLVVNVIQDGKMGSYRHIGLGPIEDDVKVQAEHAYLNVLTRGDLTSLKWVEAQHKYFGLDGKVNPNEQLIHVYYAPINFRDVMLATGKLPPDSLPGDMSVQDCILGLEFAGRDASGKRVMGMAGTKGIATTVIVKDPEFMWPVPESWSMEEASTIPVCYSTAYYSLVVRGGLQPGESVLIHSGSGGVGQAAISICLSMGCQVFTSVGSVEKREFLKKEFPQLKDKNIANSRDTSFEQHVLRETRGRGVDLVLNSLSDEKLQASVRCLAQHGRFLEIGKYDLSQNNPLGMSAFLKNIAFHGILLDSLFIAGPNSAPGVIAQKQMVAQLIREGIKTGAVRPLKRTLFEKHQAENAFRFMATGRHIGKVVLKIRDEEKSPVVAPVSIKVEAIARSVFRHEKSYVLAGGLGGFGLELAHWMVERGAKKLVISSRSGPKDAFQKVSLKRLQELGAKVVVSNADITTLDGASKLISEAKSLGPVGGVFNLALVLKDGLIENLVPDTFAQVISPKLDGTLNLDKVVRSSCPQLEYFVGFSSLSCGRGSAGQSNYGFANSAMERVIEHRKKENLPALAVQWGTVGDVGVTYETLGADAVVAHSSPQRIGSCLSAFDRFLQSRHSICASSVFADSKNRITSKKHGIIQVIGNIMGIKELSSVDPSTTLIDLGVDSLMAVEVKQTLERDYDVIFSLPEVRALTIGQLAGIGGGSAAVVIDPLAGLMEISFPSLEIPSELIVRLNEGKDGRPIFFLPPLEGVFNLLEPVAKQLNRPVIGLNWTPALKDTKTVKDVASFYLDTVRAIHPDDSYDFVGYSFGSVVAFEMSLQVPVKTLVLLDGSPSQVSSMVDDYMKGVGADTEKKQHIASLVHFVSQFVNVDSRSLITELEAIDDEEQRYIKAAQTICNLGGPKCDHKEVAFAAAAYFKKIQMVRSYKPGSQRSGDTLLIRAEVPLVKSGDDSRDYSLSRDATGTVDVRILRGNHTTFLAQNLKEIVDAINDKI